MLINTFDVNTKGRDFVVGDMHGCKHMLDAFMQHVAFGPKSDRMFSNGDLVDRGPDSFGCLKLLWEDWFFSVKGNHEELMLDYFSGGPTGSWWFQNGGGWYKTQMLPSQLPELQDLLPVVDNLPLLMTVNMRDGRKFHVIHAELDSDDEVLDDTVMADEARFDAVANTQSLDGPMVIWGRVMFRPLFNRKLTPSIIEEHRKQIELHRLTSHFGKDLSTIYSGHTIMVQPTKIGKQINLDTGAFIASEGRPETGLTFTEPLTGRFWTVKHNLQVVEADLVEI